jgi:predicted house-cleaning noncanonical NTP pyrophosphatase (MazG superfamily)
MSSGRLSSKVRPLAFSKYDIALFIDEKGKTRWSHLLKEFVENGSKQHISRQKLSDYLKELCSEGLVNKTVDKQALMLRLIWRVYPVYVVPKSRKKRIEEIRKRKKIYEFVDSASPQKIKKLHEAVRDLEND